MKLSVLLGVLLLWGCHHESKQKIVSNTTETMDATLQSPIPDTSGYLNVNGIRMYYEIYGSGKPLVILHGGGSTIATTFGRLIPHLTRSRQIIAVELQAHGHTSDRRSELSFEQDADDVAALLKELNISKCDFLGFSNGGTTAIQIAIRHPQVVDRVIAASSLLKRDGTMPQFWEFMKNARIEQMPLQYKQAFLDIQNDSSLLQNLHDKCARRMVNFRDVSDQDLRSIQAPVLLVNGDRDVATSEHMVEMAKVIPNCQLAIIPGQHGEYLGEITTLKAGQPVRLPILPIIEKFLE